jgi:hypothetical protein
VGLESDRRLSPRPPLAAISNPSSCRTKLRKRIEGGRCGIQCRLAVKLKLPRAQRELVRAAFEISLPVVALAVEWLWYRAARGWQPVLLAQAPGMPEPRFDLRGRGRRRAAGLKAAAIPPAALPTHHGRDLRAQLREQLHRRVRVDVQDHGLIFAGAVCRTVQACGWLRCGQLTSASGRQTKARNGARPIQPAGCWKQRRGAQTPER